MSKHSHDARECVALSHSTFPNATHADITRFLRANGKTVVNALHDWTDTFLIPHGEAVDAATKQELQMLLEDQPDVKVVHLNAYYNGTFGSDILLQAPGYTSPASLITRSPCTLYEVKSRRMFQSLALWSDRSLVYFLARAYDDPHRFQTLLDGAVELPHDRDYKIQAAVTIHTFSTEIDAQKAFDLMSAPLAYCHEASLKAPTPYNQRFVKGSDVFREYHETKNTQRA